MKGPIAYLCRRPLAAYSCKVHHLHLKAGLQLRLHVLCMLLLLLWHLPTAGLLLLLLLGEGRDGGGCRACRLLLPLPAWHERGQDALQPEIGRAHV